MSDTRREFVADRLWLLVAVVTLPLTALAAVFGGSLPLPHEMVGVLVSALPILGWFLLTPLLLLFGDEIAAFVYGPEREDRRAPAGDDDPAETEDAVDILKRRYASGDLSDEEFERKLDRLIELDQVEVADADLDVLLGEGRAAADRGDREFERER